MVFESFKGTVDMPITPHSLRVKPLKTGKLSAKVINELISFLVDVCQEIQNVKINDYNNGVFKSYTERFSSIQKHMVEEVHDKNGNLRLFPAEYVEVIYIVTFYCCKYLNLTQEQVADIFGIDKGDYKDRWGISPIADCKLSGMTYQHTLPLDKRKNFLTEIIPYIGKTSAELSSNYFICISNEMSLFSNLVNANKSINRGNFKGRQFLFNISTIDDLYKWVFYENINNDFSQFKKLAISLIDSRGIEDDEDFLRFLINGGIEVKAENLFVPSEYVEFHIAYMRFKENIEKKVKWQRLEEYYLHQNDKEEYDYILQDDGKDDNSVISLEEYQNKIKAVTTEINTGITKLVDKINISSLINENNVTVLEYIVRRYKNEFIEEPDKLFNADKVTYCAKYFIKEYFSQNGVSKNSLQSFQNYLQASTMYDYLKRCKNDYISSLKNGIDIGDNNSVKEKLLLIEKQIHSKKENRTISRGLIFIDADSYNITNEHLFELKEISTVFYFIIAGTKKLKIDCLIEKQIEYEGSTVYIYTNEKELVK